MCLEVKVNEAFELRAGKGKLKVQMRLANSDWSSIKGFKEGKTVVMYDGEILE